MSHIGLGNFSLNIGFKRDIKPQRDDFPDTGPGSGPVAAPRRLLVPNIERFLNPASSQDQDIEYSYSIGGSDHPQNLDYSKGWAPRGVAVPSTESMSSPSSRTVFVSPTRPLRSTSARASMTARVHPFPS
jgi:hypothetical protein